MNPLKKIGSEVPLTYQQPDLNPESIPELRIPLDWRSVRSELTEDEDPSFNWPTSLRNFLSKYITLQEYADGLLEYLGKTKVFVLGSGDFAGGLNTNIPADFVRRKVAQAEIIIILDPYEEQVTEWLDTFQFPYEVVTLDRELPFVSVYPWNQLGQRADNQEEKEPTKKLIIYLNGRCRVPMSVEPRYDQGLNHGVRVPARDLREQYITNNCALRRLINARFLCPIAD